MALLLGTLNCMRRSLRVSHSYQSLSAAVRCHSSALSITSEGKSLQLTAVPSVTTAHHSSPHDDIIYNGIWLRHNCRCSKCHDKSSSMNMVHHLDLSEDIKIETAQLKDDIVKVKWSSETVGVHEGEFPLQWLLTNNYKAAADSHKDTKPLIASSLPTIPFSHLTESDEGTYKWLKQLNYYGISLITDAGTDSNQLQKIISKFPQVQRTIFDQPDEAYAPIAAHLTQDVKSDLAHSTAALHYHQDFIYYESPPGIVLLYCIRRDPCVEGGANEYVDLYAVASKLRETQPDLFDVLTKVPVTFTKINYVKSDYEHQSNLTITRPHIQLDRYGEIAAVNWNSHHQEPIQLESEELVQQYYKAFFTFLKLFEQFKVVHLLQPGEMMSFNNRRFIHTRDGFELNGGVRHLKTIYFHIDYLRSQFLVLGKALNKKEPSKNTFANTL